jgi:hypothetical protein
MISHSTEPVPEMKDAQNPNLKQMVNHYEAKLFSAGW